MAIVHSYQVAYVNGEIFNFSTLCNELGYGGSNCMSTCWPVTYFNFQIADVGKLRYLEHVVFVINFFSIHHLLQQESEQEVINNIEGELIKALYKRMGEITQLCETTKLRTGLVLTLIFKKILIIPDYLFIMQSWLYLS